VYATGIGVFAVAGVLCGFAPSVLVLIALRAVQGFGGALLLGNGLAIIANAFPGGQRGRAVGIVQVAASLGSLVGTVHATLLVDTLGWQSLFWVLGPLGTIALWSARGLRTATAADPGGATVAVSTERSAGAPARPDLAGAALLFLTLTVATLSLSHLHGGENSFQEGWAYHTALQAGALLLLGAFVFVERRQRQPLLPFRDLRNPGFDALAVANGLMHMTMMASIFTLPFLFERALGLPPAYTGACLVALQVTWVAMAYVSGWLYDRLRATWLVPLGMALIAAGLLGMGLTAPAGYAAILASGLVLGVGTGLFMTANSTLAVSMLPAERRGLATGVLETTRQLGHSLGVAIAGALMGSAVSEALGSALAAEGFLLGFQQVVLVMAAVCGAGVLLTLVPFWQRGAAPLVGPAVNAARGRR
jgi:MFS family permease